MIRLAQLSQDRFDPFRVGWREKGIQLIQKLAGLLTDIPCCHRGTQRRHQEKHTQCPQHEGNPHCPGLIVILLPSLNVILISTTSVPAGASQFHPEFKSKPFDPHPLFEAFVRAAVNRQVARLDGAEKS